MLKFQYFAQLLWRAASFEKTLMLGKIEGGRRGWQRVRQLDGIINSVDKSLSKLWAIVNHREAWCGAGHKVAKVKHTWVSGQQQHRFCLPSAWFHTGAALQLKMGMIKGKTLGNSSHNVCSSNIGFFPDFPVLLTFQSPYVAAFCNLNWLFNSNQQAYVCVCVCVCVCAQSCPTLCNPMYCSLPGSSLHGTIQAVILERVAIYSSKGSFPPRNQTHISCIGRWILYHWATRERGYKGLFHINQHRNYPSPIFFLYANMLDNFISFFFLFSFFGVKDLAKKKKADLNHL